MFTGIVTAIGTIDKVEDRGDLRVTIACPFDPATIAIGASIACSGVCLTVVERGRTGRRRLVRGRCLGRNRQPHGPGPMARRPAPQPRTRAQGRRRARRAYRHRPCRCGRDHRRLAARRRLHAPHRRGPGGPRAVRRRQGLDRHRRRLADRQCGRGPAQWLGVLRRQHDPPHQRSDHAGRDRARAPRSTSRSTPSPATSSGSRACAPSSAYHQPASAARTCPSCACGAVRLAPGAGCQRLLVRRGRMPVYRHVQHEDRRTEAGWETPPAVPGMRACSR